jgi:hypothetical protein
VFIHGWVYDIENGEIKDLGISVGPPGKAIPPVPFASVVGAAEKAAAHGAPATPPIAPAAAAKPMMTLVAAASPQVTEAAPAERR